ncbi:MAG: hypothetical protein AAFR68_20455 [Pseudomonadota bacterium]
MSDNKPEMTLRDGNLKATIWKNEGDKGAYFTTTLARTYTDERGGFHDTNSFSGTDLLRLSELARKAYGAEKDLRAEFSREGKSERRDERTPSESRRDEPRQQSGRQPSQDRPQARGQRQRGTRMEPRR